MEKKYSDNIKGDYALEKGVDKDVIRSKYPDGSALFLGVGGKTGSIRISFPVVDSDTFVNFKMKLFDFTDDGSFEMHISGYVSTSGVWSRTSVQTIASKADRDFTVRFGNDTIKDCVWIGELDSVWNYSLVCVSDFAGTYNNADRRWAEGWSIGLASSFPDIKVTKTDNLPFSDGNKIKNLASEGVGTVLSLAKVGGTNYNYAAASTATEYTVSAKAVNGYAASLINAASEPKVKLSSGTAEEASLQITGAVTTAGDVTVTLDGVSTAVAVALDDTAVMVADKIRGTAFTGWTTGGTAGTDTVTFTCDTVGVKTDATYADGGTGATGSMTTTTQGIDNTYATKISGADFVANSEMELVVESKDGTNVRYFFLNASAV